MKNKTKHYLIIIAIHLSSLIVTLLIGRNKVLGIFLSLNLLGQVIATGFVLSIGYKFKEKAKHIRVQI